MAKSLGERIGERVGYRMRDDSRVGPRTRIEVLTKGTLTRMLQRDPALEGVGLLIFDEFHERSLHADLGLALALQARELLRDDLRILVISATLQSDELRALLGKETPLIVGEGRSHPVKIRHLDPKEPRPTPDDLPDRVAREIRRALEEAEGDLLAFLPEALKLPSGTRSFIDYSDPERPALEALLQEIFGWRKTPKILDGALPLTLRLLTPARRPLALTRDLESFWREVYPEVRRELRGRYPKHHWPEDPLNADAVRGGVKRKERR